MPEIWIPYGDVEALVTLQAENLGSRVEPEPEKSTGETERLAEMTRKTGHLFICDSSPTTVELLKELAGTIAATTGLRAYALEPKRIESLLPDLRGRVVQLRPPQQEGIAFCQELSVPDEKLFVGTARPDPLFGIVDARVSACLNWVGGAKSAAADARKDFEPTPFERTESYDKVDGMAASIPSANFLTVISRSGRVRSILENAPFEAIRNGFYSASVGQSKALIVGAGGRGYDDTLSGSIRSVWGSLGGVRKSGTVLVLAECSAGLGSRALEMLVSGRIATDTKRKERYVDGLEEVYYLNKLTEEYEMLLLSGLPELYAKNRLGFTTAKGAGEAVGRLLNKAGKTAKVNVVTRAAECRISPA